MNDKPIVEDLVHLNVFLYDIDIVDGSMIEKLAKRSVGKCDNTPRLLRYNSPICYVFDINALFKAYRCRSCDTFFIRATNWDRRLPTCSERVEHVYPKNVYQLRETLLDKLNSFGVPYTDHQKPFNKMSIFDFESICVEDEAHRNNDMDCETHSNFGVHIVQLDTRSHFPLRS